MRRTVAAPLTPDEIAQRAAAEHKRRAEEAERMRQLRLDRRCSRPIAASRTSTAGAIAELRELDRSIRELRARESELIERQRVMIDEATHTDKSDVAASPRPTSACSTARSPPSPRWSRPSCASAMWWSSASRNTVADTSSSPRRLSPRASRRCRVVESSAVPPGRAAATRGSDAPSTPQKSACARPARTTAPTPARWRSRLPMAAR